MEWQFIVALILAVPIILVPVALVWYLNVGGIYTTVAEARKRKAARREGTRVLIEEPPAMTNVGAGGQQTNKELIGTKNK